MEEHLKLLGHEVEDKVSGFKGVVTSVSFELYGCVQAIVDPGVDKDGKRREQAWFDVGRLKKTSKKPVMDQPKFSTFERAEQGGEAKPLPNRAPGR